MATTYSFLSRSTKNGIFTTITHFLKNAPQQDVKLSHTFRLIGFSSLGLNFIITILNTYLV